MTERDCLVPTRHGEFSAEHSTFKLSIPDPVQHFLMCHVYFCVTFLFCVFFYFSLFFLHVRNK